MKFSKFIEVKLEKEGEAPAVFRFRRAKLNDALAPDEVAASLEKGSLQLARHNWEKLVENLDSVSGLEDDEGKTVTTEDVKGLALPIDIMNAIVEAYFIKLSGGKKDPEAEGFTKG